MASNIFLVRPTFYSVFSINKCLQNMGILYLQNRSHYYPIWGVFYGVNAGQQVSLPRWQNKFSWQLGISAITTSIFYWYSCFQLYLNKSELIDLFSETRWLYFGTGFVSQVPLSCKRAIFNKITKRSPDSSSQSPSTNMYRSQKSSSFTSQILVVILAS